MGSREFKQFSAGPASDYTDGTRLSVLITEHKYNGILYFRVFVGSDISGLALSEAWPLVEYRVYLSRDAMTTRIKKQVFDDSEFAYSCRSDVWVSSDNLESVVEIYEQETNDVRNKFGFPSRIIPNKWRGK